MQTVAAGFETEPPPARALLEPDAAQRGELVDPARYIEKYQGKTVPLSPWLRPEPPFNRVRESSSDGDPKLSAWLNPAHVEADERFDVEAELSDSAGHPVAATLEARVRPRGRYDLELHASMQQEERSGRTVHVAAFEAIDGWRMLADSESDAPLPIDYLVEARVAGAPGRPALARRVTGLFFIHRAGAAFIQGSARIERRQAPNARDLTLSVDIQVDRSGSYWAGAELWGADRPIAMAQLKLGELAPGRHSVALLFGGQVIRDSGVDGPYTVRNARLKRTDTLPPHEAPAIAIAGQTQAYRHTDFQ